MRFKRKNDSICWNNWRLERVVSYFDCRLYRALYLFGTIGVYLSEGLVSAPLIAMSFSVLNLVLRTYIKPVTISAPVNLTAQSGE